MKIVSEKVVKGKRRVTVDLDEGEQLKKQLSSQPQQSE